MRQVKAQELLENPEYSSKLRTSDFYDLLLRAGYDADVAQAAANQRGQDRLMASKEL